MTEENRKLFEDLTQDRLEDALRLDPESEKGKIQFDESMKLMDRQLALMKHEADVADARARQMQEIRAMVADLFKWGVGLGLTVFVAPKIKNALSKDLAMTFANLEREDVYGMTPYKTLKGMFRYD